MKDSGIPWIGEIPSHWSLYRIKHNTFLKGRIGWQGLNSNDFLDEGYCLITGTDFDNKGGIHWETCYRISKERFDEDELLHVKEGDLLMTKDGTVGKMAIIKDLPEEASLNSHLLIIRQLSPLVTNPFLYWIMVSDIFGGFVSYYQTGTIMSSISQTTLGYFSCFVPSIKEQKAITDYLDKKCSEIDELITLQEKIIEELKSYKLSVITKAVTKGLNPNVPMKDSEIEWIKKMPEGWKSCRLKNVFVLKTGTTPTGYDLPKEDSAINWYTPSDILDEGCVLDSSERTLNASVVLNEKIELFPMYSILFVGIGSAGKVGYILKEGYANQQITALIPKCGVAKYYFYFLIADKQRLRDNAFYTILPIINNAYLSTNKLLFPPIEEQQAIANYLDKKCAEIDSLIALKQSKIEQLKEYKKSLIYEYVTGKKEVI